MLSLLWLPIFRANRVPRGERTGRVTPQRETPYMPSKSAEEFEAAATTVLGEMTKAARRQVWSFNQMIRSRLILIYVRIQVKRLSKHPGHSFCPKFARLAFLSGH